MFQPEWSADRLLGYRFMKNNVFFFFGAKALQREDLLRLYPEYEYCFVKQVHGRNVVEANPDTATEADAHYTRRVARAPVVQTADCTPILLASKNQVCAIHAGWRGVAQHIVEQAMRSFDDDPPLYAAIGPHITQPSFEIGKDVEAQLRHSTPGVDFTLVHSDPQKVYADLGALIRAQLRATAGPRLQIFECLNDTKSNAAFCSFRRDGTGAGRQYSFVVLNE